jgi:hypothetical protein
VFLTSKGILALAVVAGALVDTPAHAQVFTVTSAYYDNGTSVCAANCTFGEAIRAAAQTGHDDIHFDINGGGAARIVVWTKLPDVPLDTTIDATTQPGYAGAPLITLDGAHAVAYGLRVSGAGSIVRGLDIVRFPFFGIQLLGENDVVAGNWIGVAADGRTAAGNLTGGVFVDGAFSRIGGVTGTTPGSGCHGDCNLISGNGTSSGGDGIQFRASSVVIQGNLIGTDRAGAAPVPNQTGILAVGVNATIGGTSAAARNVVSGNTADGIVVDTGVSSPVTIRGNFIGTRSNGAAALANGGNGVSIAPNSGALIASDRIAYNGRAGVELGQNTPPHWAQIDAGEIYSNSWLGIVDGFTPAPTIETATPTSSGTRVTGTVRGPVNTAFVIQFYSSSACDVSGFGEGHTYEGRATGTTDATGAGTFSVLLAATLPPGRVVTATATESHATSVFSNCHTVTS